MLQQKKLHVFGCCTELVIGGVYLGVWIYWGTVSSHKKINIVASRLYDVNTSCYSWNLSFITSAIANAVLYNALVLFG